MKKNSFFICLVLFIVLIIAAFLRIHNITQTPPGLYPDEAINGNNALEALRTGGFKVFYPENNGREGLFMNIQAIFLKFLMPLFNNQAEPWMLRVVSSVFGILTVLGVYFLTKELFKKNSKSEALNPEQTQNSNIQNSKKRFRISNLEFRISHGEKIALLSSFFLAVSFWHVNFSRIGFRAIMAPFFLVWTLYFLLLALRKATSIEKSMPDKSEILNSKFETNPNNQNSKFKRVSDFGFRASCLAILAGLLYGLGFYSYIAYRGTPLLILIIFLLYWLKNKEKAVRKRIAVSFLWFLLFTFITSLPLGLYFLDNPQDFLGRTSQISVFSSSSPLKDIGLNFLKTAGMFNFMGDWNWRHNIAGRPLLFWPVGILFLIGIFLAVKSLIQNSKIKNQNDNVKFKNNTNSILRTSDVPTCDVPNIELKNFRTSQVAKSTASLSSIILFSWLIIAALPVVVSNEGLPHALRAVLMAPAVFILAGFGGVWLMEKFKIQNSKVFKFILYGLSFIILSLFIFEAYNSYFVKWARNPNTAGAFNVDYVQIAEELEKLPKETPKYVVVEAPGIEVDGIPMPAQTVMFITDTFTPEKQKEKNIFYVLPGQTDEIPQNGYAVEIK